LSHAPVGLKPCDLLISFRRYRCLACGKVHSPQLPLVAPRARISEALRGFVHFAASGLGLAFRRLAQWLKLSWATLRRCLAPAPDPLVGAAAQELRQLCLDEVFFCEPRRHLTVLSCASGRVLGLAEGRGAQPSRNLLSALPEPVLERVETLATDLSLGQRRAALDCLPNALVCADHFHVVRLIRKRLREAPAAQRPLLGPAARQLRETLRGDDSAGIDTWLKRWLRQGPPALAKLYGTVDRWQLELEAAIETKCSTGPAGALNRKIALLRRLACGYTNIDSFIQRILWLNHPPHHEE
jgi:transposase